MLTVGAPGASADVADAEDCVTNYLKHFLVSDQLDTVEVTYTPPATVTVSADGAYGEASAEAAAAAAFVDCVV
jgi:hypothetical protein